MAGARGAPRARTGPLRRPFAAMKAHTAGRREFASTPDLHRHAQARGDAMFKHPLTLAAAALLFASGTHAQATPEFATGNMRFNAKAMDTDHDGKISKDEFMKYAEQKFDKMKNSQGMISVADATTNFARGNQRVASKPDNPKASSAPAK